LFIGVLGLSIRSIESIGFITRRIDEIVKMDYLDELGSWDGATGQ